VEFKGHDLNEVIKVESDKHTGEFYQKSLAGNNLIKKNPHDRFVVPAGHPRDDKDLLSLRSPAGGEAIPCARNLTLPHPQIAFSPLRDILAMTDREW